MMRAAYVMIATLAALAICTVTACGAPETPEDASIDTFELSEAEMLASGREIVETQCASCHAIGEVGQSPREDAPPLRTVLATYAPEALAEDFREQVHVGHPDMPDFDFGPIGTDHVLAYLKSIQVADPSEE